MRKIKKLINRFSSKPKNFTYKELKRLLSYFGYEERTKGKTSGSRISFVNNKTKHIINLHKPHPRPELKRYQLDYIEEELKRIEVIK